VSGWVDEERGANPRGREFHDPGGLVVATAVAVPGLCCIRSKTAPGPQSIVLDMTAARIVVEESARSVEVIVRDRSIPSGPGRPPRFETLATPVDQPLDLDIIGLTAAVLRELVDGVPPSCRCGARVPVSGAVVAAYLSHERGSTPVKSRSPPLPSLRGSCLSHEWRALVVVGYAG